MISKVEVGSVHHYPLINLLCKAAHVQLILLKICCQIAKLTLYTNLQKYLHICPKMLLHVFLLLKVAKVLGFQKQVLIKFPSRRLPAQS